MTTLLCSHQQTAGARTRISQKWLDAALEVGGEKEERRGAESAVRSSQSINDLPIDLSSLVAICITINGCLIPAGRFFRRTRLCRKSAFYEYFLLNNLP